MLGGLASIHYFLPGLLSFHPREHLFDELVGLVLGGGDASVFLGVVIIALLTLGAEYLVKNLLGALGEVLELEVPVLGRQLRLLLVLLLGSAALGNILPGFELFIAFLFFLLVSHCLEELKYGSEIRLFDFVFHVRELVPISVVVVAAAVHGVGRASFFISPFVDIERRRFLSGHLVLVFCWHYFLQSNLFIL